MKKILSIAMMLFCVMAAAQKPVLKFDTMVHDFGEIQEANGPVTFEFKYNNGGKTPLVLHQVQASCGCTTPEWTRTPVQPGKSGSIKVTFNPQNRPGQFNKTITVQSNAETPAVTLRISGNVLQKPKTMEDEYPVVLDKLRLSDSHLSFTKMAPGEVKTAEVKVWNNTSEDVTPEFINLQNHIKIAANPATIKAGETGVIVATYDAALKGDWGFVSDQVYVIYDGQKKYSNRLTLTGTIAEDFSKMSEAEMANAPVIAVDDKEFDFGVVGQGSKVEHDYVVTNNGQDKLIIRKVKASCGCTAVTPAKTILEKGESTTIHTVFDSRGKSGRQQKTITVISNDPKQSNILLRISGTVSVPSNGN